MNTLPCDNCGEPIPADYADVSGTGLRMCDACLARPDDDPEAMFRAAAEHKAQIKVETIEDAIAAAEGVVIPEQVAGVRDMLDKARAQYLDGDRPGALAQIKATFLAGNGLHNAVAMHPTWQGHRRTQQQRAKAGFSSGEQRQAERQAEWHAWQREYDRLHNAHSHLPHTRISDMVGKKFGCTGRTVRNHVTRFKK